jgi:protocatechuate 3,4-dioxygenase beta subunit
MALSPNARGPWWSLEGAMLAVGALAIATFAWAGWSVRPGPAGGAAVVAAPSTPGGAAADGVALATASSPEVARRGPGDQVVAGTVIDAAGAPVVGVWVSARPELDPAGEPGAGRPAGAARASEAEVARARTAADGGFRLEGVVRGRARLRVEGGGVLAAEVRFVEVPADALRLLVAREIAIGGRVVDGGAPGQGARVFARALDGAGAYEAIADAGGRFALAGLPEGVYRVWAVHRDRAARAVRIEALGGPPAPIELALGPATVVEGVVVDRASGRPVVADVVLTADGDAAADEPVRAARTGGDGGFRIEGVPAGEWIAEAAAPGYVVAEAVVFTAGRGRLRVELVAGASIDGRVVDARGAPVADAAVVAEPIGELTRARAGAGPRPALAAAIGDRGFVPSGELGVLPGPLPYVSAAPMTAVAVAAPLAVGPGPAALAPLVAPPALASRPITDRDGRFRLAGLDAGRYRLRARHRAFAEADGGEVVLEAGAARAGVTIVLASGYQIVGLVRDGRGVPVAGAAIVARSDLGGATELRGFADAAGRFRIGPLAGAATITASASRHGAATVEVAPPGAATAEREVALVLERAEASLAGRVVDPSGYGVAGATIELDEPGAARALSDGTGRFRIEGVTAGRHRAKVSHPDAPPRTAELTTAHDATIELGAGGGVAGVLRDRGTGAPLANTAIVAEGPAGAVAGATTDRDGRFTLTALAPGPWTLRARHPGYAAGRLAVEVVAGHRPREVTVRDVRLALGRGATVAGVVRDPAGARLAGARVHVGEVSGTTDRDGRFRLRDVATGAVVIEADHGELAGDHPITLAPGDEFVTLELTVD